MGDDGIYDPYNNPQAEQETAMTPRLLHDFFTSQVPAISVHRAVAIPEIAGYKQLGLNQSPNSTNPYNPTILQTLVETN